MLHLIARSVHGLEWVLADEVSALDGATDVAVARREVRFDLPPGPAPLLRTADDLLLEVGRLPSPLSRADLPGFADLAGTLPWQHAVAAVLTAVPRRVSAFDVVAAVEGRRPFNRFDVEAAVAAVLVPVLAAGHLTRTASGRAPGVPDLTVRLLLGEGGAFVGLRVAAAPLHRRDYKLATGPGTLHPPLAAALARLAAPSNGTVLDPFCGDGTIAIEAALLRPRLSVIARDLDPDRVRNALANAQRAGVSLDLGLADASSPGRHDEPVAAVLTNPPWSRTVAAMGGLSDSPDRWLRVLAPRLGSSGVLACVAQEALRMPDRLGAHGWTIGLRQRVRVSGRLADVVLAGPPGGLAAAPAQGLLNWRRHARERGVLTGDGF